MLATLQLSKIGVTAEVDMLLVLFTGSADFVDRHAAMIHRAIPNAKRSAWGQADEPLVFIVGDCPGVHGPRARLQGPRQLTREP